MDKNKYLVNNWVELNFSLKTYKSEKKYIYSKTKQNISNFFIIFLIILCAVLFSHHMTKSKMSIFKQTPQLCHCVISKRSKLSESDSTVICKNKNGFQPMTADQRCSNTWQRLGSTPVCSGLERTSVLGALPHSSSLLLLLLANN